MKRLLGAIALIVGLLQPARADIILSFTPTGVATSFTVPQGGQVTVPVYLVERATVGPSSGGILATEGLLSMGIRLNYTGDSNRANVTTVTNGAGFNFNTNPFPLVNNAAGFSALVAGTTALAGVPATTLGDVSYVQLGTFTFQSALTDPVNTVTTVTTAKPQASGFPEFVTNDTFTTLESESYSNIFYAGGDFGSPISYGTTITVVPVPEPTLLLAVLAPIGVAFARRRRRLAPQ